MFENKNGIEKLIEIMKMLRNPKTGCPWDNKQTIESLKPYILEEAYETVEAIDNGFPELKDELGDLLLQVAFVSQIASETGEFAFNDVAETICSKLIRRHPHIFGDVKVKDADEVLSNWNRIKKSKEHKKHLLDGTPSSMPALLFAARISEKAATIGFDWDRWEGSMDKLHEEIGELSDAVKAKDRANMVEEMGDLLFAAANLSRKLKIDPEDALKKAAFKFKRRFTSMEDASPEMTDGKLSLDELEALWLDAKSVEKEMKG